MVQLHNFPYEMYEKQLPDNVTGSLIRKNHNDNKCHGYQSRV